MALLRRHTWPGNLRELASVLRTAAMMAEGEPRIDIEHLPEDFAAQAQTGAGPEPATGGMRAWEIARIRAMLARHDGNVSVAARELGVSRNMIYRRLR